MLSKDRLFAPSVVLLVLLAISSSNVRGETASASANPPDRPFQELYDQGVDRYLGVFVPTVTERLMGNVVKYQFVGGDGPLCFTGNEFSMYTRDGASEELMIFLQGGGACGLTSCEAVDFPLPIVSLGILDPRNAANPAANFDLGYIPYCDGTLFSGDREVDSNGDGSNDRFFRGIQNLSAALDVIASTYPAPRRILLVGNSAGGLGVHYALPLVRKLYPEVPIDLVNDSGIGIQQPGAQESLIDYWNSAGFFPASCSSCIGDDGNLTNYYKYQLAEDENVRMGFISSTRDEVVIGRTMIDGAEFEAQLTAAMAELEQAYPDRFRSLVSDTEEHTFVIKQFGFAVANTTVLQWITDMLSQSDDWVSASD